MIRSRNTLYICAALLLSVGFVMSGVAAAADSPAEELMKVMPDDVLGFVATSGGDSLKADFEKTILGRLWRDPGVNTFRDQMKSELLSKLEQEAGDPNAAGIVNSVLDSVKLALGRPIIAGIAQKQGGDGPPVYGFLILDAGSRKAEIASVLSKLESLDSEGDIVEVEIGSAKMHAPKNMDELPVYWGWVGNHLVIALNDSEGLALKRLSTPRATVPGYFKNLPGGGDALVVYSDYEKIANMVKAVGAQDQDISEAINLALAVLKELGLNNVKSGSTRVGFAGPDVVSNSLLEVPAPRTGLFESLKPVDMRMLDAVDAGAMNATAFNCDLASVYDTVLGAVKTVAGENYADIEQAIAAVEGGLQFKIRDGLLQSLNGQVVSYTLGSGFSPQSPMGGFVLIAGLRDAGLWEETMGALGRFAAAQSGGMVQVNSQQQDGRTIHTWAVMPLAMAQIMPTWTVTGDKVVIASSPAICSGAVEQINSGTKSIRGTEGFKRATAELPANPISLRYTDSKLQFTQLMTALQQFWPMVTMAAGNAGVKLPFVLPNLSHIAEDMDPSCQYWWFDEYGLRSRYRGSGIEPSLGAVAGGALGAGILMPALARTRQMSRRIVSGSNLSSVGEALLIFSHDYADKYPANLNMLVEKGYIEPETLESEGKPNGFNGPSFIYIGGQNPSMNRDNVLAYENPEFCRGGLRVLFTDSRVEWVKPDEFLRKLEATYKRLDREMPEIEFKSL
ncbi:MAG: hypothetical protein ACYSWO_06635 [Planctomycetota bacterium]